MLLLDTRCPAANVTEQPTIEPAETEVNVGVVRLIEGVLDEVLDERSFVHCTNEDFARAIERSLATAGRPSLPYGAVRLEASIVRKPARCKRCSAPCICPCHGPDPINEEGADD